MAKTNIVYIQWYKILSEILIFKLVLLSLFHYFFSLRYFHYSQVNNKNSPENCCMRTKGNLSNVVKFLTKEHSSVINDDPVKWVYKWWKWSTQWDCLYSYTWTYSQLLFFFFSQTSSDTSWTTHSWWSCFESQIENKGRQIYLKFLHLYTPYIYTMNM